MKLAVFCFHCLDFTFFGERFLKSWCKLQQPKDKSKNIIDISFDFPNVSQDNRWFWQSQCNGWQWQISIVVMFGLFFTKPGALFRHGERILWNTTSCLISFLTVTFKVRLHLPKYMKLSSNCIFSIFYMVFPLQLFF